MKYDEYNHPGRKICDTLRDIRRKIAAANGIPFETKDCHATRPCRGTCPVCDEEINYLNEQIRNKQLMGEEIILDGLGEDDVKKAGCDIDPDGEEIMVGNILPPEYFKDLD